MKPILYNKRIADMVTWTIVAVACIASVLCVYKTYKRVVLVKYENKDVVIGKAKGKTFHYLYRSFEAKDLNNDYNDSAAAQRPLTIGSFRWAKFPSIHRYVYHDKISDAHFYYFYYEDSSNSLYAISVDKKPSKTYLFLDILSDRISLIFLFVAISQLLFIWFVKKFCMVNENIFSYLPLPIAIVLAVTFCIGLFL